MNTVSPEQSHLLTENEEIALAVVLWKNLRQVRTHRSARPGRKVTKLDMIQAAKLNGTLEAGTAALRMAVRLGVKDEFLKLMFAMPVMEITFTELEEWESSQSAIRDGVSMPNSATVKSRNVRPMKKNMKWRKRKPKSDAA